MTDQDLTINQQEKCDHRFVIYYTCCDCGHCTNSKGEIVQTYAASDMKKLSDDFSEWYFSIKEDGKPPLAIQIMYWFSKRVRVNIFEYDEEIKKIEGLIELKEKERSQWADLAIKKQEKIESLLRQISGMKKDTEMFVVRELGLEELVWQTFLLSVSDLPKEDQDKKWLEYKKEKEFNPLNH